MAAKCNFTKDETQEASRELFYSAEFTKEVHSKLIFLSVVNTFLALTAFLRNTLILLALKNETSLHLLLRRFVKSNNKLFFVFSFSDDTVCNKCGQTSRPVISAQVQTSCNFEKSMYDCNRHFYCGPHLCIDILLESSCSFMDSKRGFTSLFNHLNFLLHENFHLLVSWPGSSTGSGFSRTNFTEHSSIQKGSVRCAIHTSDIGYLLFAWRSSGSFDFSKRDVSIGLSCQTIFV